MVCIVRMLEELQGTMAVAVGCSGIDSTVGALL